MFIDCDNAISLQVKQQNAGLIIRNVGDGAVFEMFELSPNNGSVFATRGRLIRSFPAIAVHIDSEILTDPNFQSSIGNTLATMSHQRVPGTVPQVRKGRQSHDEERDTTSPSAVTELLASVLLGFGKQVPIQGIRKHTREEVFWKDSKFPWRRSPTWLLVRVTLQLGFQRVVSSGRDIYKKFMVYFMAQVLETSRTRSFGSDVLHTMSAKIIRRLSKLRNSESGPWIDPIRHAMEQTSQLLDERWLSIRRACETPIDLSRVSNLKLDQDVYFDLPNLDNFLSSIFLRKAASSNNHLSPKSQIPSLSRSRLPYFPHADPGHNEYKPFQLFAIESWVSVNLGSWIRDNISGVQTCENLASLLLEYHEGARVHYENSPEGTSRMVLTLLEIWIAMDKSAVTNIPLMGQYSPQIPLKLFRGLVLGRMQDMGRLFRAEEYLLEREKIAGKLNRPSIISSFGTRGCFSGQYFDQSTRHQDLLHEIQERAHRHRQEKLAELRSRQREYTDLMDRWARSFCEYYKRPNRYGDIITLHDEACAHCNYEKRARDLSIQVHEWPLPSVKSEAKSTVFELDPPQTFRAWRDATVYLIDDVLGYYSPESSPRSRYHLGGYGGLKRWYKAASQRVYLLSESKPHLNTHRRDKPVVNLREEDVCVNNGLHLQYFDDTRDTFLTDFCPADELLEQCTIKLPPRSTGLNSFILRTHDRPDGKLPNEVLAEQHLCPDHLSILEGKALMSLSYGHEVRWLALLTHLESPQVDFGKPETVTFLLQICLQSGPNTIMRACRNSHVVLTEDRFALALSKALEYRISRIEKNPEAYLALWGYQFLAARVLSTNENLQKRLLAILVRCRQIAYQWAKLLHEKSLTTGDERQRMESRDMMFNVALACVDSFNVGQVHLKAILDSAEATSILVEVSIRIRDNIQLRKTAQQQDHLQAVLFDRWQVLMHRSSAVILDQTLQNEDSGLHLAIERCWPAYTRDGVWKSVPSAEYWLETSSSSKQVLYNTLLGELLVDGSPLSRLPQSYKTCSLYEPLFGRSALDVRPSDVAGMSFLSQGTFCGHEVHFGMQASDNHDAMEEMLLHTTHQGSTYDLVPSRVLAGYIPEMLAADFVHWYHHETGEIEFRQRSTPWVADPSGWRLKKQDLGTWILARGAHCMASPLSETARHIAAILGPLESIMHIHVIYEYQKHQVDIQLPRLKLAFYLQSEQNDWQPLQSRQFQGMQVDENQSIGTLVGLRNRLVLKDSRNTEKRLLLVPEGQIGVTKSYCGHVNVTVANGTASRVQSYGIDAQLGRITDNGTLQSKLFLCYLHALTSYCVPDPFTMHTGTEQALSILESAAIRSWSTLTEENVNLFRKISSISPIRKYYPEHLREMQSVTWRNELSYLSQPGQFFTLTKEIIERVQRHQFLYPNSNSVKDIDHTNFYLVEREAIRSASLYVSTSVATAFTADYDHDYVSRDRSYGSERALSATRIAAKIKTGHCSLESSPDPRILERLWELLRESSGTLPPRQHLESHEIRYDSKWLAEPEKIVPEFWCRLHYMLGHSTGTTRYQIAIWLASLAYSKPEMWEATQVFYAFACIPDVGMIDLPAVNEYELARGYQLDRDALMKVAKDESIGLYQSPEWSLPKRHRETGEAWHIRRETAFSVQLRKARKAFTSQLLSQWACLEPRSPTGDLESTYINIQAAMTEISSRWRIWYQNLVFRRYLQNIVSAMDRAEVRPTSIPDSQPPSNLPIPPQQQTSVTIDDMMRCNSHFSATIPLPKLEHMLEHTAVGETSHGHDLQEILDYLDARSCSVYQRNYIAYLRSSDSSLDEKNHEYILDRPTDDLRKLFRQHWTACRSHVNTLYKSLVQDTSPVNRGTGCNPGTGSVFPEMQTIAHCSKFWPRTPPSFFLGQLQRNRWARLPEYWRQKVVEYGLAITELQRADRLFRICSNEADLIKELRNVGHESWSPFSNPEWLLLECESGLLIRQVQENIAQSMMTPPNDQNATMQLNMGEGKSSVIVPIVAAALGDGSQLVRVIVTKPQFKQMHQILVSKLAGMVGRQIYQLPTSRDILPDLDALAVGTIQQTVLECKRNGGVLLVQPEQLLSFQLMGLESQINKRNEIAPRLLDAQAWLDDNSRDIVDESDEIFSVKFELVYTMGQQRPIENSPARWELVQQVLGLVKELAQEIHRESPQSLEVFNWQGQKGRFPRIRILDAFGSDQLLDRLTECIFFQGLDGFPITRQPEGRRKEIIRYISEPSLSDQEIRAVENSPFWHDSVIHALLLLRGLIAQGIIAFSLGQKRWRVNYGVDQNRDPKTRLAVPFRAKDDPAPRAEFSHPDVAIFLTCLSYYYSGLDCKELLEAFERLKQDDQAQPQFHQWKLSAPTLPPEFSELVGINLRDKVQFDSEVFPHLQYSKGAIDYFLSKVVFAREMKEFPHKLSTSGWDLGKIKKHPTTGFSGTNDSRYILPLTVTQLDQAEQRHTNALVLRYLRRPGNSVYRVQKHTASAEDVSDGKMFLETVSNLARQTRVILDVGAQVTDLTNRQVAETWLDVTKHHSGAAQAVIFFDEEDVITVLDRSGHSEPFQTSHFAKQTDKCFVFLDEAHTRGTDLQLPHEYRAAVTLGAKLTKDRLLQGMNPDQNPLTGSRVLLTSSTACMRMRKLGHGQSIVFCVPEEIEHKIMQMKSQAASHITVSDIIKWAITETMDDTTRSIPLWVTQGLRFGKHSSVWHQRDDLPGGHSSEWAKSFLENESKSLEQRYRPNNSRSSLLETSDDINDAFKQKVIDHRLDMSKLHEADLQEEQERELSPEAEEERQIERPPPAAPMRHAIHANVKHLVHHGFANLKDGGFQSAFTTLDTTSAAKFVRLNQFPQRLLVTDDFAWTVRLNFVNGDQSDFFQRPVNWVLTSTLRPGTVFIVSAYEVQKLLPQIRASAFVTLHLYAPRTSMSQRPLDHLALYTVPDREAVQIPSQTSSLLNLFAGQLYMQSYEEYTKMCDLLGLAWTVADDVEIEADGFIPQESKTGMVVNKSMFTRSPTKFLQIFMTNVRRNNESIEKTHMGKLLSGTLLGQEEFDADQVQPEQSAVASLGAEVGRLGISLMQALRFSRPKGQTPLEGEAGISDYEQHLRI